MADSTSQFLGTFLGGGAGGGSLVTAAGLQFTQAGAPGASTPYWNYDGTNLVGNVPAGKGFSFTAAGATVLGINTNKTVTTQGSIAVAAVAGSAPSSAANFVIIGQDGAAGGTTGITLAVNGTGGNAYTGRAVDGATAIALALNSYATLSTSGALLSQTQNNGAPRSAVTFDGVVVASGMAVGSRPAIIVANAMLTGADTYIRANTTGGAFSITLPDVTKCGAGASQMIAIKCVAVSANVLTLKGWGAQTIAGAATMTITPSTVKEGVILFGDGISDWQPLGEFSAAL